MTYHNAVKYLQLAPLESKDPMALATLWDALDAPQKNIKYLRLTGNNGKTVCAELLLSAFQSSEYVVGSLSLPLYNNGKTNVRIGTDPISTDEFTEHVKKIVQTIKAIHFEKAKEASEDATEKSISPITLSQSELLLTIALLAFRQHRCSFCIFESDASPEDPTRRLPAPFAAAICGTIPSENQEEIQRIRSYIIHGIQEIVCDPQDSNAYRLISELCASVNCRLSIPTKSELRIQRLSLSGSEFSYKDKDYKLGLLGKFQIANATVVLEMINMLSRHGFPLAPAMISNAFLQTKIPAKFEIVSVSPTIIVDSTYSQTAIEVVCEALADFQPILGQKLCLCLPDNLSDAYTASLINYGFSIESWIPYDTNQKTKALVTSFLANLSKSDVLLISGYYTETIKLRDEILKQLHR